MSTRTGYWRDKATQPPPRFGAQGTVVVEFTGELPCQHRGAATQTLYVFTERHPRLVVDKRDLPALASHVGRDQLRAAHDLGDELGDEPAVEEDLTYEESEAIEEVEDYGSDDDSAG